MSRIHEEDFTVFDFETTGFAPDVGHRPCEIAAVRGRFTPDGFETEEVLDQVVDPQRLIPDDVQDVHGIGNDDVQDKPAFQEIAGDVRELMEDSTLVAHNAQFDLRFLKAEFDIAQLPDLSVEAVDTCQIARNHFSFSDNKLETIADELNLTDPTHRSLDDVRATIELLNHQIQNLEAESVKALIEAQGGPVTVSNQHNIELPQPARSAQKDRKPLQIAYESSGKASIRTITPLRCAQYRNKRYLISYCHQAEAVRAFRFDRIKHHRMATREQREKATNPAKS